MARKLSKEVSVEDLEFVTEYLVRLSYAPLRSALSSTRYNSIRSERETVLRTALIVEDISGPIWDRDRRSDVEKCCRALECVIEKTLSDAAIRKMRTAIRQSRMVKHPNPSFTLAGLYDRWTSKAGQRSFDGF